MYHFDLTKLRGWRLRSYHRFADLCVWLRLAEFSREQVYLGHGNIGLIEGTLFIRRFWVLEYSGQ